MLSPHARTLLVFSHSSNSSLMRSSPSPSTTTTTTPSLTSVNTVLDHKSPSPSVDRVSPSHPVLKFSSAPVNQGSSSFHDLDLSFSPPPAMKKTPPPFPLSASPLSSSPNPVSPAMAPPLVVFTGPLPVAEPSLDEALDKLLAMSFTPSHTAARVEDDQTEARCVGGGMQEVQEELILPVDRSSVQPNMFSSATNTITDESVDGGADGNGDLDWADEELSVSFHDGLDGTMTPFTERPYTDGSVTPLTEASWMDESMTPSSCPGTPEAALDLPLLQTPGIDRVSASGHVRPPRVLCSPGCDASVRANRPTPRTLVSGAFWSLMIISNPSIR